MDIKLILKSSVAAAALVAVAAPVVSGSAQAGLANGNDNSVVMSGQIIRSVMYADNGESNQLTHVDGGNDANSRLRILVSGKLTESVTVGGTWEANLPTSNAQGSQTSATTGGQGTVTDAGDNGAFGFRKADVSFSHATMGKLSIGQNSTASDNKPSLDSTGNNNAGLTNGGGMFFYDKTAATQTITAGGAFPSYFGTRSDRVQYDSPNMGGFAFAAAVSNDEFWDVGLTYGATYGDIEIAAAAQYTSLTSAAPDSQMGVGVALKHSSGISAGVHYGQEDGTVTSATATDGSSWGAEIGYTTTAMSNLGATSFNLVYAKAEDTNTKNDEATVWGLHVAQAMPAGVSVFASYEVASYDGAAGTNYDDLSVALIGTQLNF